MADTKLVNLRVDVALLERFDRGAKAAGRSRTAALVEYMTKQADHWDAKAARLFVHRREAVGRRDLANQLSAAALRQRQAVRYGGSR